jgi:hypothetical protein
LRFTGELTCRHQKAFGGGGIVDQKRVRQRIIDRMTGRQFDVIGSPARLAQNLFDARPQIARFGFEADQADLFFVVSIGTDNVSNHVEH